MDNVINLLPDNIANQIAAGEVIQRPASVIKELVENSVDAGATEILIEVKEAGKRLIQVIDNGKGMAPLDARMAFERHATSKIRRAEDLFALTTMGFRGEALASIAAVSQTLLQTRQAGSEMGTRIELEGSKVLSSQSVLCALGANFSVRNLFFNVPARRKFLKGDDTEFRHIVTEIQRVAIVHPNVHFSLTHDDRLSFRLDATTTKQRIIDLFGKRLSDTLLNLHSDTPILRLNGFVSRASASRKRGALQYLFVNDRFMKHPFFHRTVMNAYEGMIPAGEQPEYFLFLQVDPADIDVNIHPTKTEIKFAAEGDIAKIIYSSVRECLMKGAAVPSIDFNDEERISLPTFASMDVDEMAEPPIIGGEYSSYPNEEPPLIELPKGIDADLASIPPGATLSEEYRLPEMSDWASFYQDFYSRQQAHSTTKQSYTSALTRSREPKPLIPIEPEVQRFPSSITSISTERETAVLLHPPYALLLSDGGVLVMHIERAKRLVMYNEYMSALGDSNLISQRLLFPQLIDLGIKDEKVLLSHLDRLHSVGFDISDMGARSYAVNAIPYGLPSGNEEELLLDLLGECSQMDKCSDEVVRSRLVALLTDYRMRKESTYLTAQEAHDLFTKVRGYGEYPLTYDGRTIFSLLTTKELDKRF